jgi:ferredoxin/flavodoxin---NADP+ reductase
MSAARAGELVTMPGSVTLTRRRPAAEWHHATVIGVRHWDDRLFSFSITRAPSFRFENGQFVMIGLQVDGRPLMRAYSVVSPNYEHHLEFLSIKVPGGPLTSRLRHLRAGDEVTVGSKPTGSLLVADLRPGRTLYLLATGTGLAPFMSIIRDPYTYERFERVILVHSACSRTGLAYRDHIVEELPHHEYIGEMVRRSLVYYPTVTREPFERRERITDLIESGRLFADCGALPLDAMHDRIMICGCSSMVADVRALLDARGFTASPRIGSPGDYVYERAFVET